MRTWKSLALSILLLSPILLSALQIPSTRAENAIPSDESSTLSPFSSISFEPNVGQFHEEALYVARFPGGSIFVTHWGAALYLPGPEDEDHAVFLRVAGGWAKEVVGEGLQPGVVNVIRSDQTFSEIPRYARVRLIDVRPGIDLVFYAATKDLEYDVIARPGSDIRAFRLGVEGADVATNGQFVRLEADRGLVEPILDWRIEGKVSSELRAYADGIEATHGIEVRLLDSTGAPIEVFV